jgi:hypothetical protein
LSLNAISGTDHEDCMRVRALIQSSTGDVGRLR